MSLRSICVGAALTGLLLTAGARAEPGEFARLSAEVSEARLMETVRDLSRFGGRQAGTAGGEETLAYISARLPQNKLQPFPVNTVHAAPGVQVAIDSGPQAKTLRAGTDFIPILSGVGAEIDAAPIMFAGYGISDAARGWDDYAGKSVRGRVVLFLRGQPKSYGGRATQPDKVRAAKANGALAYLMVTGPALSAYERRRGIGQRPMASYEDSGSDTLPGLWLSPETAAAVLPAGVRMESFQTMMEAGPSPGAAATGHTVTITMAQRRDPATAANVLGFWPGSDPELRDEVIVLGAHHDHFGTQAGILFPGADDNASGTAILIEIGRVLAIGEAKLKRSVILIAFAAEEQGLLGSRYYASHPARPLSGVRAMINVDHAGVGNGKVTVGLGKLEKALGVSAGEQAALNERVEVFGFFPGGDHVPFAEADIPTAAIVTSGAHADFHQPSDTMEKIQPEVLGAVARYTLSLLLLLANQ